MGEGDVVPTKGQTQVALQLIGLGDQMAGRRTHGVLARELSQLLVERLDCGVVALLEREGEQIPEGIRPGLATVLEGFPEAAAGLVVGTTHLPVLSCGDGQ